LCNSNIFRRQFHKGGLMCPSFSLKGISHITGLRKIRKYVEDEVYLRILYVRKTGGNRNRELKPDNKRKLDA